jgi:hypothetical protein
MPHLDINELHREKDKRFAVRNEIYNKVLMRCHNKIKSISKLSDICCCFFEVPAYMYGLPAYNQIECIYYIIKELMDDGFKVEFAEPNILFVAWYDKPKRKSLADIAFSSKMPMHNPNNSGLNQTKNYNVNNRLYHDGLSELEVKTNKIFNDELYNPRKDINHQSKNIGLQFNKINRPNTENNKIKDVNFSRENRTFVDFNPGKSEPKIPISNNFKTINMYGDNNNDDNNDNNIKSFSFNNGSNNSSKNNTSIKKDGFRSLFNDNTNINQPVPRKKFSDISLSDIDKELGLDRPNSPVASNGNNSGNGFSMF